MAQTAPPPTGTVTLLFTDIDGSTQHWEQQPAAMPEALRRHDELLRAAIVAHGGHVFKTVGDAFCAAFSRALDAVVAAADAQRALAREDWSAIGGLAVRMALHSGATDERDGDYFGPSVNRIARLLAIAHGGQVVASSATAHLLLGVMPERTDLRDLGEHRLKDLVEPEHVWQLLAPGLPDAFPPLQSLGSLPNNLPRQVTPLIGRNDVLAQIDRLVIEHPLVTLVGTGGIGKTRLALQAGADLLDGSADGVWFVELSPLSDAASVVNAIASTFGLREQGNRPLLDVLLQYFRPRRLLLILDNCEHLIREVARVAAAILRAAPQVAILATSREPLRIPGEHVYRVPSLAVPRGDSPTSEEALQYGAIALFAERASALDAKFRLTDESAPFVAEICRRLDGIALAIELAAARVRVLPPRRLAQKLDERFRLLIGGSRAALPRQQTMRALIDWSHDLLSQHEQRLFRRLAIFVGGWTLEAADAVCTDETFDALDVINLLASLVDKSLVVAEATENPRYRFLESTRAFALEKLVHSGEGEALARRQAQWAADLGDRAYEAWRTVPTSQFRAEFAPELENLRSAIAWAISNDEVVLAARVAGISEFYWTLGGEVDLRGWFETLLERLDTTAQPALAARTWNGLALVTVGPRKIEAAQRAVELSERCSQPAITTLGLSHMAYGLMLASQAQEAQAVIDQAVQISKEHNLTRSSVYLNALNVAAIIAHFCGRLDDARHLYAEALALATALSNDYLATSFRLNMGELEFQTGNPVQALEFANAVVAETHGRRADYNVMVSLVNRAAYSIALGEFTGARTAARDVLRLGRGAYVQRFMIAIQHLATVAACTGDPLRGARLRGYVDTWYRCEGLEREPTEQRTYGILTTALRDQLTGMQIETLAVEGARLSEDQAVAEALAV
ncbi:MAG: adenylate/guanylate cyclase domain-containing protein [Candidatus Eremiobacteraeota bacterium]|nr:adenylate/guanylate cyclase domain-containing protein [Candidatus Eremiobacteraeota bacterium]